MFLSQYGNFWTEKAFGRGKRSYFSQLLFNLVPLAILNIVTDTRISQ